MSGKLCFGSDFNNAGAGHLRSSKSFCEGAIWRQKGTALAFPVTDNPHVLNSEAFDAWAAGWTYSDDSAGSTPDMSVTCCAAIGAVLV